MRPIDGRKSTVAEGRVDDVALVPVAGGEHFTSLGFAACIRLPEKGGRRYCRAVSASDGNTASEWVPTGSVTVRVPGKVNLYLAVGDRRDDGYHELTTVFHAVSLLDEVTVSTADVLSLELTGEGVESLPTDERNLAWRAAELMADHVGRAPDVAISIDKSIPVAGGMAGGSADGAAVLVAMNTLWELGVPRRDLHTLAAQLGSDVPFALHGGTALGTGRGEELATVLGRNIFHWVLAFAEGGLSTPAVFAELDRLRATAGADRGAPPRLDDPEPVLAALASGDPAELAPLLGNDLQPASLSLDPGLRRTLRAGVSAGALAGIVSGSGPTCAFLCTSASAAIDVGAELSGAGVCRTVRVASGPVHGARVVPTPSTSV
jgi:4-diphosphocytidyl-2-C-methyl-D-erythritol kinase